MPTPSKKKKKSETGDPELDASIEEHRSNHRKRVVKITAIVALVIILIAVILGTTLTSSSSSSSNTKGDNKPAEPTDYEAYKSDVFFSLIGEENTYLLSLDKNSPQRLALQWLQTEDDEFNLKMANVDLILERFVLGILYYQTGGTYWTGKYKFMSDSSACNWFGIANEGTMQATKQGIWCDTAQNIVQITLSDNNLDGQIPTEIGLLRQLTSLSFEGNTLSGDIFTELGELSLLQSFSIARNNHTGTIPTLFGKLKRLESLDFSDNELSGTVPNEITANLQRLKKLQFYENSQLAGTIPTNNLQGLNFLQVLDIQNTQLTTEYQKVCNVRLDATIKVCHNTTSCSCCTCDADGDR